MYMCNVFQLCVAFYGGEEGWAGRKVQGQGGLSVVKYHGLLLSGIAAEETLLGLTGGCNNSRNMTFPR